jgi:hypothetical protein
LTATAEEAPEERSSRNFKSYWTLGALVLGLSAGEIAGNRAPEVLAVAAFVGA